MTFLMLALLAAGAQADADACADVFDRTEECASPAEEAWTETPGESLAEAEAEVGLRAPENLEWGFFSAAIAAGLLAGALNIASFSYDAHLASLHASNLATPANVDPVLARKRVFDFTAIGLWSAAALFAGTGAAFLVFDPAEGRVRDAFAIEE